jgi:hypothetical protein
MNSPNCSNNVMIAKLANGQVIEQHVSRQRKTRDHPDWLSRVSNNYMDFSGAYGPSILVALSGGR